MPRKGKEDKFEKRDSRVGLGGQKTQFYHHHFTQYDSLTHLL